MQNDGNDIIFGDFPSRIHYHEHLARYRFAARYARDRLVLDLGCGARDGPFHLAGTARKVVAADYLPAQLCEAREKYGHSRISCVCCNALHLGFRPRAFETVVSLEVIEHLEQQEDYLAEICACLVPEGTAVLSTPNREMYPVHGRTKSDHHVRELTYAELEALLGRFFHRVEIYGIWRGKAVVGMARALHNAVRAVDVLRLRRFFSPRLRAEVYHSVARKTGARSEGEIRTEDIQIIRKAAHRAPFLIAVCTRPRK